MNLVEESIHRMATAKPADVVLYLDERGTPGTDTLFITGGVLVYGLVSDLTNAWSAFWQNNGFTRQKGTDLNRTELLTIADFLIHQSVLPVAVYSRLAEEELARLREFARKYRKSSSQRKKFKKISPASWVWKHQMSQTIAVVQGCYLATMGPIGSATVYLDEFHEEAQKKALYRELLTQHSRASQIRNLQTQINVPAPMLNFVANCLAPEWRVELTATGALARMADVCCAMFGRKVEGRWPEAWDVIRLRFSFGESHTPLPCLEFDLSRNLRAWLEWMYESGDPDKPPANDGQDGGQTGWMKAVFS